MTPTRRHAALGLVALGAATLPTGAARAAGLAAAEAPELEKPDTDEPNASLDTTTGRYEHMLAPVTINGEGPFRFLLDTGANISCVSHDLAQRLDLKTVEVTQVHTVVGVRSRPIVILDELTVGTRNRKNVRAPSLPIKGREIDGVLGVDWLKGQRLVLDFKGRKMEITRSRADVEEAGKAVVIPARRRHGQLTIVDADMGGVRISAILDSGAQGTFCNTPLRELARRQDKSIGRGRDANPTYVRMETLAGESFTGESLYIPFLRLGGLHLGNVAVTHADMHVFDIWGLKDTPAMVLGMDLLSQFERVSLDFGRSQVRFDFV